MICKHCSEGIHESIDPAVPYVHDDSGNTYCDVTTPDSAVGSTWANAFGVRDTATPKRGERRGLYEILEDYGVKELVTRDDILEGVALTWIICEGGELLERFREHVAERFPPLHT